MTAQEREAVRKVVETRPPKLISLNESSKVVPGDAATVKDNVTSEPESVHNKNCDSDKEEKEAMEPMETSSRRFTCIHCNISFKLQIQLNRHKKHCIKKEPGSSIASPSKKPTLVPLSPGSIKTEPDTARRHSLPVQTSDLLAQHPGLQLKRTSLPNKPLTDPGSPVLKPSLSLKPTPSLLAQPSPSKTKVTKAVRRLHLFKKGSNWQAPSPGKGF